MHSLLLARISVSGTYAVLCTAHVPCLRMPAGDARSQIFRKDLRSDLESDDQNVAPRRPQRVDRLDRGDPMIDPLVVQQRGVQWLSKGKAREHPPVDSTDLGGATGDIGTADHEHEHIVNAVTMHAFRRRLTRHSSAGFDAKLMGFDIPGAHIGSDCAKGRVTESKY